ncbi:MAG: glutamine synthetase [Ignavibacteriales bacterium]|nr:glutamine synthetase [Ignavibacteriales bacterium]
MILLKKVTDQYDKNFLDPGFDEKIHYLPRNLTEALDALSADNDFLKRGGISLPMNY